MAMHAYNYNRAKSAMFYYINKQKNHNIAIRKKQGYFYNSTELHEWRSSAVSAFNKKRWYPVHRNNIVTTTAFEHKNKLLHGQYVRDFFNLLLQGHTVVVSGYYNKETKTLCLDVQSIQLKKEVINR